MYNIKYFVINKKVTKLVVTLHLPSPHSNDVLLSLSHLNNLTRELNANNFLINVKIKRYPLFVENVHRDDDDGMDVRYVIYM